jgi:cytochrome c oxidase subunit I
MAIIERPRELAPASFVSPKQAAGNFHRPVQTKGWKSWLFTVDHKKLGIMYGAAAMFFFLVGGVEALLIRVQLAQPNGKFVNAQLYNELFTTHGTTMVFLFIMPMAAAFANYFVPLQIGARDVAFPTCLRCSVDCPMAAGLPTPPIPAPSFRPVTVWTSGRSPFRSPVLPR